MNVSSTVIGPPTVPSAGLVLDRARHNIFDTASLSRVATTVADFVHSVASG